MSTLALARNITEIQTGIISKKKKIFCKIKRISTKMCVFLARQGLIHFYTLNKEENKYEIYVKYVRNLNIIKKICLVSKPSFKVFYSLYKMRTLLWKNKNNIYLISAPTLSKKYASGFINQNEAVDNNIGGEVLVKIEIM